MTIDAQTVACTTCEVPPWTECRTYNPITRSWVPYGHSHIDRQHDAELADETSLRLFPLWYNDL